MISKFAIILAAGQGTRMKTNLYKVLHPICGKTMVDHVLTQVEKNKLNEIVTVVGYGSDMIRKTLGKRTQYVFQKQQLGTGHAVLQAESILGNKDGMTLVVCGDTPLLTAKTFNDLFKYHEENNNVATVLTAETYNPFGYGRIVRNTEGLVNKIVEQKDANDIEKKINEINTGVYVFNNVDLFRALHKINNNNMQSEYYLTDIIGIFKKENKKIGAYKLNDFSESMGVNDLVALSKATKIMQLRINSFHMRNGVTIIDPNNTYIDIDVKIGKDTIIEPNVYIKGKTVIGEDCIIRSSSEIINCNIENKVEIISSYLEDSIMHDKSNIGPFSHLRPLSEIGDSVHIGNFVEIKKSRVGRETKIGHLTYVGNAKLGKHINVGCGTVFVNYDGMNKHDIFVGDYSFIGSGTNLIAPLNISDHAYIAAGSTITDDIPPHSMGIGRSRQINKIGYYDRYPFSITSNRKESLENSDSK